MSNSNTPNEQPCRPESVARFDCTCPVCAPRAEAAARAPETAAQYLAREQAEIFAARRARLAESDYLRTFLKDCTCPCCEARARLRAISYDRAEHSAADIHCASTDRRDDNEDPRRAERIADLKAFARAGRYADNADKAIRAATEVCREDTDTGPARAD